jgi:hypothetical protein
MACSNNSVLGSDVTVGLNTEFEFGDKRMRNLGPLTVFPARPSARVSYLVCSKEDMRALHEAGADQVSESVVLLVEGEDGGRGNAYKNQRRRCDDNDSENSRVSISISTLLSPFARTKDSYLHSRSSQ